MKHYIIYDSRCPKCTTLAESLRQETTLFELISLHNREGANLLSLAFPDGYTPAPYLVQVDEDGNVRAWTGIKASVKMVQLVGPIKAINLWQLSMSQGVSWPWKTKVPCGVSESRRGFLRTSGAVAVGAAFIAAVGFPGLAQKVAQAQTVQGGCSDFHCDNCFPHCNCDCIRYDGLYCTYQYCNPSLPDYYEVWECWCGLWCGGTVYCSAVYCDAGCIV